MPFKNPEQKKAYDRERYWALRPFISNTQLARRVTLVQKKEVDNAYRRGRRAAARQIAEALKTAPLWNDEREFLKRLAR